MGAGLLAVCSAGLGVPFLLSAVAFGAPSAALGGFAATTEPSRLTAGMTLILMGVLVYTDQLFRLSIEIQKGLDQIELNFFQSV